MTVTFYNGTRSDAVVLWLDYDGNEVCTIHKGPAIPAVPDHTSHSRLIRSSQKVTPSLHSSLACPYS